MDERALVVNIPKGERTMLKRLFRNSQRGAALLEYSLLVAGIALIGAAAVATFGHKTTDMLGAAAAILPGAHADDNAPIISGRIIETTDKGSGQDSSGTAKAGIALDVTTIIANTGKVRLGNDLGTTGTISDLVLEPK
jgi:pilus assembly protein Flp/PilA